MKNTNLLIAIFMLTTCFSYSQMDVVSPSGNDGVTIRLNNTNNYDWEIVSESNNSWGHSNTLDFIDDDGTKLIQLYPDNRANVNGRLNIDYKISLHMEDKGTKGGANGYDFNPNTTYEGMLLEQVYSEASGFYSDGDYAVIYSPGDYGYLLKVIDEDGMNLKWYINSSGYDYHSSDERKKKNINTIAGSLDKVKALRPVSYNFILTDEEKHKLDSISNMQINGELINKEKKAKEQKKCYGFIAQELETVIDEVVETDENGNKFVNYDGIIPVLVSAIQEQQDVIEKGQVEITQLTKRIENLEKEIQKIYLKLDKE